MSDTSTTAQTITHDSSTPTKVSVTVRNDLDKSLNAQLIVVPLTFSGRLQRALKVFGICLGAGVICLFIPVLHFVLVPLSLLIGLFLFYREFTFHDLLISGEITCPKCNKKYQTKSKAFNWPKYEACPHCGIELILQK